MKTIEDILANVRKYRNQEEADLVKKAYNFAAHAHEGQVRLSGDPYFSHPIEVAYTLSAMRLDGSSVAAGLLHDTVEDTMATIEEIDEQFGEDVADIVDGVTKISLMSFDSKEAQQAENIRKMILAMNEDMRVLFVKLADRLHNMTTLDFQKPEKRVRIAQETMDIYAPLANRLGLHRIKLALEDLSFKYLSPDDYNHIAEWLEKNKSDDEKYIQDVINLLQGIFTANDIKAKVKGRIKHIYSIYRKMKSLNISLDEMHDIIAFRAIVSDIKDCYAALGLVHATWKPVPGRFKDYISMPKGNMYQSLHTTVIGPRHERMEVQIRSDDMDKLAEHGHASHWLYKEGSRVKAKDVREFAWLREMLDWQKMESNSHEFLRTLRFDLFKDEIYVFTPQGAVKELPEGATSVDFAYLIHTQLGDHCAGGKVNGKLLPLSTPLKSGDTIEIITDPNRHPSRDWLNFVKTAKARTRIQHHIRTKERDKSIVVGREMLEKQARRLGLNFSKLLKEGEITRVAKELRYAHADDLISAVGYARLTPRKVLNILVPKSAEAVEEQHVQQPPTKSEGITIQGVGDILTQLAKCCNPVPGDQIIGFSSRGRGVIVHRSDCPHVTTMEPERLLTVVWEGREDNSAPFPARIKVVFVNQRGMLAKIAAAIDTEGGNIDSGHLRSTVDGKSEFETIVEVSDLVHLYRIVGILRKVESVFEVQRISISE